MRPPLAQNLNFLAVSGQIDQIIGLCPLSGSCPSPLLGNPGFATDFVVCLIK